MALIKTFVCHNCTDSFQGNAHTHKFGDMCSVCQIKKDKKEKDIYLSSLDGMTLEERIRN